MLMFTDAFLKQADRSSCKHATMTQTDLQVTLYQLFPSLSRVLSMNKRLPASEMPPVGDNLLVPAVATLLELMLRCVMVLFGLLPIPSMRVIKVMIRGMEFSNGEGNGETIRVHRLCIRGTAAVCPFLTSVHVMEVVLPIRVVTAFGERWVADKAVIPVHCKDDCPIPVITLLLHFGYCQKNNRRKRGGA
jgi:hypothetical protein